jgi:hypothetical protein
MSGCKKDSTENGQEGGTTPTNVPTKTVPVVTDTPDITVAPEEKLTVQDYYPLKEDAVYIYEGSGNEYASMTVWMDFYEEKKGLLQTRTNNGGTETVRVIERTEDKVSVLTTIDECYYRDRLFEAEFLDTAEVLLMEPLIKGTEWTLSNNRKRYISNTEVQITTPLGTYLALEVTTESPQDVIINYYAPGVGLVKTVFVSEDLEITSSLKEIKEDAPYNQDLIIYYPKDDGMIYRKRETLYFHTNDITAIILENAVKKDAAKDTNLPLISSDTKIKSLSLGKDNKVNIDLSKEFIEDMNVGAEYEALVLQSITNTLGNYYQVSEVIITVEGKPYESGHFSLQEGEAFTVDMEKVIQD